MANIATRVCGRYAYHTIQEVDHIKSGDIYNCLADFTPATWQKVILEFDDLKKSLLRKDAGLIVLPYKVMEEGSNSDEQIPNPDENINHMLFSHECFTTEYAHIVDWMKFHACISHIQPDFHEAIRKIVNQEEYSDQKSIPEEKVIPFR